MATIRIETATDRLFIVRGGVQQQITGQRERETVLANLKQVETVKTVGTWITWNTKETK